VAELLVQEEGVVSGGDLLALLETTDVERAVAQAELGLLQAQLGLERLQEPADEADIRQATVSSGRSQRGAMRYPWQPKVWRETISSSLSPIFHFASLALSPRSW